MEILQNKDGVTVARIYRGGESYILKSFAKAEYRREIDNYRLLQQLGIPTMQVIEWHEDALLLEDIDRSPVWRLGVEGDMDDIAVAEALATWYRQLHDRGREYVVAQGASLYDEANYFTRENIAMLREKLGEAPAWEALDANFDALERILQDTPRTLNYNDFYYTNLLVARDGSAAAMFDYNLLGKGTVYGDLRNVTSSLSQQAGEAFLAAYGSYDPREAVLDTVVSPIVDLCMACQRDAFPPWAEESLELIRTTYPVNIENLFQMEG